MHAFVGPVNLHPALRGLPLGNPVPPVVAAAVAYPSQFAELSKFGLYAVGLGLGSAFGQVFGYDARGPVIQDQLALSLNDSSSVRDQTIVMPSTKRDKGKVTKTITTTSASRSGTKRPRTGTTRRVGYYERYNDPYHGNEERELKFFDNDVDDAVVAQNGTILSGPGGIPINAISQGVGPSQRVGRKAIIKKIAWRWNCVLESESSTGTQSSETLRVIMYLDRQANGTFATPTQILTTDNFQSFNQLVNSGRFTTLYDKTVQFNPQSGAGNGTSNHWAENSVSDQFFKDCNIPIEFSGSTGVVTEIRSNNIGVMLVSRAGGILVFNSVIRFRFYD